MSDEATPSATIHVLVAVHEEHRAQLVSTFLRNRGHRVACVRDGRAALHSLRDETFDVAVLDVGAHEADGLELVHQLRTDAESPELIVITGNESGETAIGALRLGAYAHLPKPYRMAEIDVLVRRAFEKRQLARENRYLRERLTRVDGAGAVVTQSPPLQAILALVERVAPAASPILISGEPGTGKRLLARHVHEASRRGGSFVETGPVGPTDLAADVELFGGGRGTVVNASRAVGLLELAAHGTLFVPAVGSLPLKTQAKLARAFEHGSFLRVSGTQRVDVSARLLASAAEDLEVAAQSERFNASLLSYISTITITLPPLRERRADVPLLARHFLRELGGASAPALSAGALERLQAYRWPGNVRELRNVMERLVLTTDGAGREVGPDELFLAADRRPAPTVVGADVTVGELERQHIEAVLQRSGWHQGRAAAALGMSPSTLYRRMRDLRIDKPAKPRTKPHRTGRSARPRSRRGADRKKPPA
jgi:DNA-binding NtrC family response regulator